jgi:hypothetical protein
MRSLSFLSLMFLLNFSLTISMDKIEPAVREMDERVETDAEISSTSITPRSTDGREAILSMLGMI